MTKQEEINQLVDLLQEFCGGELRALRRQLIARKPRRTPPPIEVYADEYLGEIKVFPQKTWFAQIKNGANVKVVDSANFIRGSLYKILRELNLRHKKETKPKYTVESL